MYFYVIPWMNNLCYLSNFLFSSRTSKNLERTGGDREKFTGMRCWEWKINKSSDNICYMYHSVLSIRPCTHQSLGGYFEVNHCLKFMQFPIRGRCFQLSLKAGSLWGQRASGEAAARRPQREPARRQYLQLRLLLFDGCPTRTATK